MVVRTGTNDQSHYLFKQGGKSVQTFDEWLADCPIPFTQTRDDGDTMTFTFEVGKLEEDKSC